MKINLSVYQQEAARELDNILAWWMEHTPDKIYGGFYGKIDEANHAEPEAPKGLVLNSRILWTFSAACLQTKKKEYLPVAQRAYEYIISHFLDREYGGMYWSVDYTGYMLNSRKQVYGLSFCIYGLSEYYRATKDQQALDHAISLFRLIEKYSYDGPRKGYYEALSREWKPLHDLRLSEKDANEKKTMNTHLHVIEAYTNLYQVWPDTFLKQQIENLLEVFGRHIIDGKTGHLILFFDENWSARSGIISYGHDIEAAWLLQEAAESIDNRQWIAETKTMAIKIAGAAMEGLDADGGLWYEYDAGTNHLARKKHWWPQAEAMVGFLNAYQLSGNEQYLHRSAESWEFIRKHIKDQKNGEWFWGVDAALNPIAGQDKAGFWKCPYHNGRACLEIMKRISSLISN